MHDISGSMTLTEVTERPTLGTTSRHSHSRAVLGDALGYLFLSQPWRKELPCFQIVRLKKSEEKGSSARPVRELRLFTISSNRCDTHRDMN